MLADARTAAATLTVLAGVTQMLHRVRDRDKDALVHALADVSLRRGLARTRPLKRVV